MQRKYCLSEHSEKIKLLCTTAIPLLLSDNPNGNANSTNNIPNPIDTIIKSINHATNLSIHWIISLLPDDYFQIQFRIGGEPLFDDTTYNRIVLGIYDYSLTYS